METRRVKGEICILKFYQSFHILLIFLIILCHIISVNKYILIYSSFIIIFYISLTIYLLNLCFLIVSTLLLFAKRYNPTMFNLFKNLTLKIIFFSLLKGIVLTIIFWLNYYYFPKFIEDCPFNSSSDNLITLIKKSKNEEYSKKCELKRCIFQYFNDDGQINKYIYLCNFDAEYSINNKNKNIDCKYVTLNDYSDSKIIFYLDKCDKYTNYYECSSEEKKHDKYFIKYNQKCPNSFKKSRYIALGILFPFIDIIADITIWLFIYCQYLIIIKYINYDIFALLTRFTPSSLNSTKDSSIIKPNNNNNRDLITQININQNETIIYPPLNDNKLKYNIIKSKEKKVDLKLDKDNSLYESKCDLINNSNTNTNESK